MRNIIWDLASVPMKPRIITLPGPVLPFQGELGTNFIDNINIILSKSLFVLFHKL